MTKTVMWTEQDEKEYIEARYNTRSEPKIVLPFPKNTVFKIFKGCMDDPLDRFDYEKLLDRAFLCQGVLKKDGDVFIYEPYTTFDKHGQFHVVCKYAYLDGDAEE